MALAFRGVETFPLADTLIFVLNFDSPWHGGIQEVGTGCGKSMIPSVKQGRAQRRAVSDDSPTVAERDVVGSRFSSCHMGGNL